MTPDTICKETNREQVYSIYGIPANWTADYMNKITDSYIIDKGCLAPKNGKLDRKGPYN